MLFVDCRDLVGLNHSGPNPAGEQESLVESDSLPGLTTKRVHPSPKPSVHEPYTTKLKPTTLPCRGKGERERKTEKANRLHSGQTQKPTSHPVVSALKICISSKRLQSQVRKKTLLEIQ